MKSSVAQSPQRILLVNPTRYLGNLLLAGGLIQAFAAQCQTHGQQLLLILDDSFEGLCHDAFPIRIGPPAQRPGEGRGPIAESPVPLTGILYYPRRQLARANPVARLHLFGSFLFKIRKFRADLAFNIEEDTTTSRLTQFSGARFRLGCSPIRQRFGYEQVLPIDYAHRPEGRRHRWYSFEEMFRAAGLEAAKPGYLNLQAVQPDAGLINKLVEHGFDSGLATATPSPAVPTPRVRGAVPGTDRPLIAIHPSATKAYKLWPESAFTSLCILLIKGGFQPVLVGAGSSDAGRCARILADYAAANPTDPQRPLDLCNRLNLRELAQFFRLCSGIVGNDSGPFHLAAALGLPGVVVFGPSDAGIWGPLGDQSAVLQRRDLCDPRCSRKACHAAYRCLSGITPQDVLASLVLRMSQCQRAPALEPGKYRNLTGAAETCAGETGHGRQT